MPSINAYDCGNEARVGDIIEVVSNVKPDGTFCSLRIGRRHRVLRLGPSNRSVILDIESDYLSRRFRLIERAPVPTMQFAVKPRTNPHYRVIRDDYG